MLGRYFQYYKDGFRLVNNNLGILIISLTLALGSHLSQIMFNATNLVDISLWPIHLISIVLSILNVGYLFVPVVAFDKLARGEKISLKVILEIAKATFFKSLLVILIATIISFAWFVLINPPTRQIFPPENSSYLGLAIPLLSPLGLFFGIFFAIENQSYLKAIKNCLIFVFKHLPFAYLAAPIFLLTWWITFYSENIPLFYFQIWRQIFVQIITIYSSLVICAATVLYYQKNKA